MPNLTIIEGSGFKGCFVSLVYVYLPRIESIGDVAFDDCFELMCLEYEADTPPVVGAAGFRGVDSLLLIVPDSTIYTPAILADYPVGTQAFNKTVPTEAILFKQGSDITLIPKRVPALSRGTYQWFRNGYPIAGANNVTYDANTEGLYTLEYTRGGGKVTLLSNFVTSELFDIYGLHSVYEGCTNQLVLRFTPLSSEQTVKVWSEGTGAQFAYDMDFSGYFADTLKYNLAANDSILTIHYSIDTLVNDASKMCFAYQVTGGIVQRTDSFTLYAKPKFRLVRFYPPTIGFTGLLEVDITNGSPYMQRSLDEGETWGWARDTLTGLSLPFTPRQIAVLQDYDLILFKQPNSCFIDTLKYRDWMDLSIPRPVNIPVIPDVICSVPFGEHFVKSREDFVFTLVPLGHNMGKTLHISTSRILLPDSEGLTVIHNHDGSYTITIHFIQEPVEVSVDFIQGNQRIDGNKVWVHNKRLFICSDNDREAAVYHLNGTLIRRIRLNPGETTRVSLPDGWYILVLDRNSCKIVIK